jgi:hypothetical protein
MKPHPLNPCLSWVWYVLAGADKSERQARMAEVPDDIRHCVDVLARYWYAELARYRKGEQGTTPPATADLWGKGYQHKGQP